MRQVEAIERDPIKFDLDTQHEKKEEIFYFHNFNTKSYETKPLAVAALKDQIRLFESIVMDKNFFANKLSELFGKQITLYDEMQADIELCRNLDIKINTRMTLEEAKDFYVNGLKIITKRGNGSISYMVNHNKIAKHIYTYGYDLIQKRTASQRWIMIVKINN
jgi:hypothetical protein